MNSSSYVVFAIVAIMAITVVYGQVQPPSLGIYTDSACKTTDKTWNPNPLSIGGLPQDNTCVNPPSANISASLLCKQSSTSTALSFQIFTNTKCISPSAIDFEVPNQQGSANSCFSGTESLGGIVTKAYFVVNCNNSTDVARFARTPLGQRLIEKALTNAVHQAGL